MAISDKLKDLTSKAQEAAASREGQIRGAVEKVQQLANERTGGKYSEQIQKAGAKAGEVVDKVARPESTPAHTETATDSASEAPKDAGFAPAPVPGQAAEQGASPPAAKFRD